MILHIVVKKKIAYYVWEAGYLADQENIKRTNQKKKRKKKRYNNVYNIAIFMCIALGGKGYIGDRVTATAKICS